MENYNSFKIHQQHLEQNLEILGIRFEHRIGKMLNPKTIWFTQMYTDTVSTRMISSKTTRSVLGVESHLFVQKIGTWVQIICLEQLFLYEKIIWIRLLTFCLIQLISQLADVTRDRKVRSSSLEINFVDLFHGAWALTC